jgi:hypothetical protein
MADALVAQRLDRLEQQSTGLRDEMNARFDQVPTRDEMKACITEAGEKLRAQLDARITEEGEKTRNYFNVVHEAMKTEVQAVAEGHRAQAQRHEKLAANHEALRKRVDRVELRVDAVTRARGRRRS